MIGNRCAVFAALVAIGVGLIPIGFSYHVGGWVRLYTHNPSNFSFAAIPDLTGKVAIVTGANTGIGKVTARELARRGAHVVVAARSEQKGVAAVEEILNEVGDDKRVTFLPLDLASFDSVRAFAKAFLARDLPLHILVLNAGVMMCPYGETADGLENQIGTNHVGHFLLTELLEEKLVASVPSRVVVLSSKAHEKPYEPEGIRFQQFASDEGYDPQAAYGQSKLANVLFSNALARRLAGRGVYVNACHPGIVATELSRHLRDRIDALRYGWALRLVLETLVGPSMFTPDGGALTQLFLATDPSIEADNITGRYYEPVAYPYTPSAHALNTTLQDALWEHTAKLVAA